MFVVQDVSNMFCCAAKCFIGCISMYRLAGALMIVVSVGICKKLLEWEREERGKGGKHIQWKGSVGRGVHRGYGCV